MRIHRLVRSLTIGRLVALIMILAFVALRFWDPEPLEMARGKTFDLYQVPHPRVAETYPVTIVDIDERALQELGQWPWSRAVVADLVDHLTHDGAVAIGFDILFAEPDRLSPRRLAESLTLADDSTRTKLLSLPDNDELLAQAIGRSRVVLGQAGQAGMPESPNQADQFPRTSIATIGGDPQGELIRFPRLLRNLPEFELAAAGRGLFTVEPERDGVMRRVPTILSTEGRIVPALSIELLRVATGATSLVVKSDEAGVKSLVVAGIEIATDRDGQIWLHYGRHDPKRYVSAADVLRGKAPPERINGKIILIGTSAVGLFDLRSTPVERVMPGVEIHAQAIESILAASLLKRPNYTLGAEICLAAAIGLGMVIAVPLLGALPTLLLGALVAALLGAGSWYLFLTRGVLLDVAYPLASSFVVFLLLMSLNYFREERRRAQIRSAFGQYLSPDLVEQLTREPDRLVLGGETRVMSVLFSDVRGFTSIAEGFKTNPSGLTALMNRLLTPLSEAVFQSERATGHRNRAIAHLQLNSGMIKEPLSEHLDLYFKQCSILVSARDLAMMAATLANNGVNPLTGERAIAAEHVKTVLSVMASCGMYDYSGEWVYRVGLPAKSGVGGGIVAVLPGQFGFGVFSPLLDEQGNSHRGIEVCKELSQRFYLHVYDTHFTSDNIVRRSYRGGAVTSKRLRGVRERKVLDTAGYRILVYELQGGLYFATAEQLLRRILADAAQACFVVLDSRRISRADLSALLLIRDMSRALAERGK